MIKNILIIILLVMVSAWSRCDYYEGNYRPSGGGGVCYVSGTKNCGGSMYWTINMSDGCCNVDCASVGPIYFQSYYSRPAGYYFGSGTVSAYICEQLSNPNYCISNDVGISCSLNYYCTTEAEADSSMIDMKCLSGTMVKDTVNGTVFSECKNADGFVIARNNPITGERLPGISYMIVSDTSYSIVDEVTYNHLAGQACVDVGLYRGVLNGKYVYWYSNEEAPAGVQNAVRVK